MKLMTLPEYMKMSKPALIRKIMKTLRAMPKVKLARICYNITKSKLPRLKTAVAGFPIRMPIRQKVGKYGIDYIKDDYTGFRRLPIKRKTKRKFSRKQLAAQRLFAKRARAGTLRRR